jgi:hypothetical protein
MGLGNTSRLVWLIILINLMVIVFVTILVKDTITIYLIAFLAGLGTTWSGLHLSGRLR